MEAQRGMQVDLRVQPAHSPGVQLQASMVSSMNGSPWVKRSPRLVVLVLVASALPLASMAADDDQAERQARQLENEIRRQDAQARRDIEMRERAQAEALRSQEESIRRMEATQARMNADAQQRLAEAEEQVRRSGVYIPMYPYIPPMAQPTPDTPPPPTIPPVAPGAPVPSRSMPRDPVGRIIFESVPAGVRVVSAGGDAPFDLRDGDVILAIDGRIPLDGPHAASILRSYRPGERVILRLQRYRNPIELPTTAP
jgi:hypothetical protein